MPNRLHLELDALNDFLVDGAGRPLQIVVDRPLKPANQRLMDSLGVEVRVTATAGGVSCLVGGCEWRFDGDYEERAAAIEKHRDEEHDYIPAHRFSVRSDAGRDALDAMDSLLTQREHLADDQADDEIEDDLEAEAELEEADEVGGAEVGNREEDAAASTSPGGEETASAGQHGRSMAERVRVGAPDRSSWSRKHVTREAAMQGLQIAARELGYTPTMWQYRKNGYRPYNAAIVRLFGSWEAACEASELPAPEKPTSGVKVWTRETIIAWLREQHESNGDTPKADYLRGPGAPPLSAIHREFGSYPAAVTAAGLEPRARGGQPGNQNRSSRSSVREPKAREAAVSPPPADVKQPAPTGDDAVVRESPSPGEGSPEAGSRTDEPPGAELLDMRTLVDEPGEWIHRLEAEGDRLLAESDRLARRAEGVHAIVHGLRIVQETDR